MRTFYTKRLARMSVALPAAGLCFFASAAAQVTQPSDDVGKARKDIETFYGRLMLPKDLDRAKEIKRDFPSLASKIDVLVAGQAEIKDEEERENREFRAENDAWQRDENKKRKMAAEDPMGAENAEKRLHSEVGLIPSVCGHAESGLVALGAPPWTGKISQATALREKGDLDSACTIYDKIKQQNEAISKAYDECNKKITGIYTLFAREGMFNFFMRTLTIRMKVLETARCP